MCVDRLLNLCPGGTRGVSVEVETVSLANQRPNASLVDELGMLSIQRRIFFGVRRSITSFPNGRIHVVRKRTVKIFEAYIRLGGDSFQGILLLVAS